MNCWGTKFEPKNTPSLPVYLLYPVAMDPVENVNDAIAIAKKDWNSDYRQGCCRGVEGRGMRIIRNTVELEENIRIASAEAMSFFSDGTIFLERYLEAPRHVEIQVLSDGNNVLYLGERDCSVQKNYQKLLEESPSTAVGNRLREVMKT